MSILLNILTVIMNFCYRLCRNYGLAIILFTLISKTGVSMGTEEFH